MDLVPQSPAALTLFGSEKVTIDRPTNIKIHTTGEAGIEILNAGPTAGKRWHITVNVDVKEDDI